MPSRLPFVLASTDQGSMIVNRFDYHVNTELNGTFGGGLELLDTANYEPIERDIIKQLLAARRQGHGDGVVALDIGANIGAHTVAWSRFMHGWGQIMAFEAQEWSFYALAGNIVLNNCLNARAFHVAVGSSAGILGVPVLDPTVPANFGGLEIGLNPLRQPQDIGAPVNREDLQPVEMVYLDGLNLPRVDLLKIDVEGMEIDVLRGAPELIQKHRPILFVEWVKSDQNALAALLNAFGYTNLYAYGMNMIMVHPEDPCHDLIKFNTQQ